MAERKSGFTLNGASDLQRTLRRAGVDIRELKPINREAAEIAMDRARSEAPEVSGALRDTLRVGATNRAGVIRAGNNRQAGVPYAGAIHWGWPSRDIAGHPFIAKSARETENKWRQLYERYTDKVLGKVKGA